MKIILNGYKGRIGSVIYDYLYNKKYDIEGFDLDKPITDQTEFDIAIDFSSPAGALKLFYLCLEKNKPLIIGTTGFSTNTINEMKSLALERKIPIYLVSNFSLSMCGIFSLLKRLSNLYESVKIEETHHISKKDIPSGTTLKLLSVCDKSLARTIKVNRGNTFTYIHEITLTSKDEELIIRHRIKNKLCYALGVEYAMHHLGFIGVREEIEDERAWYF